MSTVKEVARQHHKAERTVQGAARDKRIPAQKVNRRWDIGKVHTWPGRRKSKMQQYEQMRREIKPRYEDYDKRYRAAQKRGDGKAAVKWKAKRDAVIAPLEKRAKELGIL